MKRYDHGKIEKKWREVWARTKLYQAADKVTRKENFYLLVEFPYPSGNLHVGHWYAFAVPDILARHLRMRGKNVMYPIGFDAFGLPAENAAIKNKLNPRIWTEGNIAHMKEQIASMGTSFDWSREVVTCNPDYYKWTQWLFLQLYKHGLVYRKETAVNWCPKDKTVLANEQVINGRCERCDSIVEQRMMLQWNIKITDYADRLIDDLDALDWPEQIKESQRNWIGRSEGAEIDFPLDLGRKQKYVIFHGYEGAPDSPRWKWVKTELEKTGHEVVVPRLPRPEDPEEKDWIEAALNATDYDEQTVIVGHSLGAVLALKVLERLEKPVARFVAIGGFIDTNFKDHERSFEKRWNWKFDGETIRKHAHSFTVLHDPKDGAVTDEQASALASLLGVSVLLGQSNKSHFTGDTEPDVLMWLRPTIRVFTTRPDTLFGATYLVLAPEHPWVTLALQHKTVLKNNSEVQKYVDQSKRKTELERQQDAKEKTGVLLEGVDAINPATGERIPMYVADYVLGHYGTGAIMAVPAHDERDYEFAKKFDLPIRYVVMPRFIDEKHPHRSDKKLTRRKTVLGIVHDPKTNKYLCLEWKTQPWLAFVGGGVEDGEDIVEAARREIIEETGYTDLKLKGVLGGPFQSEFFAAHKDVNRIVQGSFVLFELGSDKRQQVAPDEIAQHEIRWLDEADIFNDPRLAHAKGEMRLLWERMHTSEKPYTGTGILLNSGEFDGVNNDEAKQKIVEKVGGRMKNTYRLRDWTVSRQRYWGEPIPMIHCAKCGTVPVPEDQLPVILPEIEDYLPRDDGRSPLAKARDWVEVQCPQCGGKGERETDTLDVFVASSWYFLRYTDPKNAKEFASEEKMAYWMPIQLYSGGAEHTTVHVLYSRFWQKALFDCGLVKDSEPYTRRMNRSLIMGPDGQKMSKSRGNVIDPDEVVKNLGADTVRMYLAFIGPYNEVGSYPWNPDGVVGVRRFLERLNSVGESIQDANNEALDNLLHKTIKKVGEDIVALKFNTAISALMIFLNMIEKEKKIGKAQYATLLKLVAPFAPYLAEELWHQLGNDNSIHLEAWPVYDESLLKDETVRMAVQVNGKTRGEIEIAVDAEKSDVEKAAREAIASRLKDTTIKRTIIVPNRLVNFVTS